MIPYEPFGSHDRFEPDEADRWAKWESKSKTMEADLQARLRCDDGGSRFRFVTMLAQIGCAVVQFFAEQHK